MNPKLLLILLVLLVAVYLLGAGLGLRQEPAQNGEFEPPAWAANLEERLVPKTRLSADHIRSANTRTCEQGLAEGALALQPGQRCTFDIAQAGGLLGGPVRRLEVCLGRWTGAGEENDCQPLANNGQAGIELRQTDRLTIKSQLPDENRNLTASLDIFQEGGILTLTCSSSLAGAECVFSLR